MIEVFVRTQFEAQHRWKDAPPAVAFLRDFHRHVFHVKVTLAVTHTDRDVEFFLFKRELDDFIAKRFLHKKFDKSCEDIALEIIRQFRCEAVEVSEDGENGAIVRAAPKASEGRKSVPFIGTEIEGPCQGARVLFVPSSCIINDAFLKAVGSYSFDRIYYGAGNERLVTRNGIEELLRFAYAKDCALDVEVDADSFQVGFDAFTSKVGPLGMLICAAGNISCEAPYFVSKLIFADEVTWIMSDGKKHTTWLRDPVFAMDQNILI